MIDITEDQILRLESVGLAIVNSISEEYGRLKDADADKEQKINGVLEQCNNLINILKKDGANDADEIR